MEEFDPPLDKGIARAVLVLREEAVETFESCEGGAGHAYPEPTVAFHGNYADGFRAYAIARENGLEVSDLRRVYRVEDGELKGPWWEMTFIPTTAP